ncbi:Hypothetical predicted protein, partial [Paramuricea clavata]
MPDKIAPKAYRNMKEGYGLWKEGYVKRPLSNQMCKLQSCCSWFSFYLINRYQQTTVLGATSKQLPVTSGVPQGSILGPLLFLLYENHLSNAVTSSSIPTFADDTKIFKTINSISDAAAMQYDLSKFEEGSTNVNLELN